MKDKKAAKGEFWRFDDYVNEISRISNQDKTTLKFTTMKAVLRAARDIVSLYDEWEKKNLVYLDNPKTTFYFDVQSGKLDVCGKKIVGCGYAVADDLDLSEMTAPEIINGEVLTYNIYVQRWSLAVVLFEFFYHNDGPYKGAESMMENFYSEEEEYSWMAKNGRFNMEDVYRKNRTIHGVQDRLEKYWWFFPEVLRDYFTQTFVFYKEKPEKRFSPHEWKIVLNQVEGEYLECVCGKKGFSIEFLDNEKKQYICPRCGQNFYCFTNGNQEVYLSANTTIKRNQIFTEMPDDHALFGIVVENKKQKGLFGIKNMSDEEWIGKYPNGIEKEIVPGGGIPIWQGLELMFKDDSTWKIKEVQTDE